jgi:hypothetical protein
MHGISSAGRARKQVVVNLRRTKSREVIFGLLGSMHAGAPNSEFNLLKPSGNFTYRQV